MMVFIIKGLFYVEAINCLEICCLKIGITMPLILYMNIYGAGYIDAL